MATIDLGKIKFNWRNEYDNSTAYVPDDCVYYADGSVTSSYICKTASTGNAPSTGGTLHGSWDYLAVGQAPIPTTTQGDIVVRGASTNERLAIGSAGQVLKVNSSGNGLEYGQAGVVQTRFKTITAATSVTTATTYVNPTGFSHTITPTSASNHILVTFNVCFASIQQYGGHRIARSVGGTEVIPSNSRGDAAGSRGRSIDGMNYYLPGDTHGQSIGTMTFLDTDHNTTSEITYKLYTHFYSGSYLIAYNRSHSDDNNNYSYRGMSTIKLQEIPPAS
mgnify:CR=1 FL=1